MDDKKQLITDSLLHENTFLKHIGIATAISTGFAERNSQVTVVGGLAVEFYTNASYMTQDIDMVTSRPDHIKEVMTELGFVNRGGIWHLPQDPSVTVEFPPAPLAGDQSKIFPVRIGKQSVDIIGVEDIIISRANEAIHWGRGDSAEEWVRYMMAAHYKDIDWSYLEREAQKEQCAEVIERCRKWAKRNIKQMEIQQDIRNVSIRDAQKALADRIKNLDDRVNRESNPTLQQQIARSRAKTKELYDMLEKVDKRALIQIGGELNGQNLLRQKASICDQIPKLRTRSRGRGL